MPGAFVKIHPDAQIGRDVTIGDFTIIHEQVVIEDGCSIGSHCIIGHPTPRALGQLVLGPRSLIRSHVVLYSGSTIGPELTTGHHVTIRENCEVGRNCQIGSYTELQGDLHFGDYSRTQSSVFIPKHTHVGRCVWLMPGVTLTNDHHPPCDVVSNLGARIDDYAVLAARCTVLPGVNIGARSLVAAHSLVTRDVPADMVVAGVPARPRGLASAILMKDGSGQPAYPWMRHFHRGYPEELIREWAATYGTSSGT